jgi:hypothetical protein
MKKSNWKIPKPKQTGLQKVLERLLELKQMYSEWQQEEPNWDKKRFYAGAILALQLVWKKVLRERMAELKKEGHTRTHRKGLCKMKDIVIFHLKRFWEGRDLWEEIVKGKKTSEWRDSTEFWHRRLCISGRSHPYSFDRYQDFTDVLKVHKAWFVVGYPKNNLPRLEADITRLIYHPMTSQYQVCITNVKERVD